MSPFDTRLLNLLHEHRTPIHSQVIADLLGSVSARTVRDYLRKLETRGYVARPPGTKRKGWLIVTGIIF